MNDQPLLFELALPLQERAERIRSLVSVARGCIIEIGRELIGAKAICDHGEWLPWLKREFGWDQKTAWNYMQVVDKLGTVPNIDGLAIDATALYALAAPDVPQAARDEAVERAESGERITKAEADKIIAEAAMDMEDRLRKALTEQRESAKRAFKEAIDKAEQDHADDRATLEDEVKRLKAEHANPDVPQAVELFKKILKRPKLSPKQMQLLAQILDTAITDGKQTYAPVSEQVAKAADENLRISSAAERALEYFSAAPSPVVVIAAASPVLRPAMMHLAAVAIEWLQHLKSLDDGDER